MEVMMMMGLWVLRVLMIWVFEKPLFFGES